MKSMNLKSILLSIPVIFLFFVFAPANSQNSVSVPFQKLEGFLLNSAKNPGTGNYAQLIFRQNLFNNFYIQNPKASKVSKIDFENQTVISLTGLKSKEVKGFSIDKVLKENSKILIYFTTQKGKKSKELMVPFCIYTIKRDPGIKGISYFLDGQLLEDVKN
jgi:hypothetical protein